MTIFPNQKPWIDGQVRLLLKARDTAHVSGGAQAYSLARADLRRGIKGGKHSHKLEVQEYFKDSDPRSMGQGLQAITDFKPSRPSPPVTDSTLPSELNHFYVCVGKANYEVATKVPLPSNLLPLPLPHRHTCVLH